jgi:VanZ family protein
MRQLGTIVDSSEFMPGNAPRAPRRTWTIWLISTLALAVLIGVLTLMPTAQLPRSESHVDKLAHLVAFLVLVLPTAVLRPRAILWVGTLAVVYGAAIEVIQPYAGRSAELADLLADGIGVGLGAILGVRLRRALAPRRV